MSQAYLLIAFGALTALSPFIGIPLQWLMWILPIMGFVVVFIGLSIRSAVKQGESHVELIAPEVSQISS